MTERMIAPRTSALAFAALVALTLATVGLSFLRMGPAGTWRSGWPSGRPRRGWSS